MRRFEASVFVIPGEIVLFDFSLDINLLICCSQLCLEYPLSALCLFSN